MIEFMPFQGFTDRECGFLNKTFLAHSFLVGNFLTLPLCKQCKLTIVGEKLGTQPIHSKILNQAAKEHLKPLGLIQKGQSRVWLDDHDWWVTQVEFQPSGWSKGSYLNVGACWLWDGKEYLSFDVGHRVAGFVEFQNEEQFINKAQDLAQTAVNEVLKYRRQFLTVDMVYQYYLKNGIPKNIWSYYHFAIAAGLIGKSKESLQFFQEIQNEKLTYDWIKSLQTGVKSLMELVKEIDKFRQRIESEVFNARALNKLKEVSKINW